MPQQSESKPPLPAGEPCGLRRRLAAMLYDAVVLVAVMMLATAIAMAAGFGDVTAGEDPLFTLYLVAAWFLYLAWFWHKGGMTLGMRAWRIVVVSDDGGHPGWGQCMVRFPVSLAAAACAGIGFAWSLFEAERRTWHDMASRTRLVKR